MNSGIVVSINITPNESEPLHSVNEIRALIGRGLEGDRYFNKTGMFSSKPKPGQEITLIEIEALEALQCDYNITLDLQESRRNIVTKGIALNHLVGKDFSVGEVRLRGIRLCEPCSHLESLTKQGARQGLIHRGGLRADILIEGVIHKGDSLQEL